MVYRSRKEFAKAIPDLDRYIDLSPENGRYLADGYLNRGIAHAEIGKPDQAVADMTKAIDASPRYVNAYVARATIYRRLKKTDLADADERKVAELRGSTLARAGSPQGKTSMDYAAEGSRYYVNGDYKKAIPPYQKAVDPEKRERGLERKFWIVVVDNLTIAYGITGDVKKSMATAEYGISVDPTYPLFYYNIACGYGEQGDEVNAIKYLRPAFKYKNNMLEGETFPNPMTDSSFAKFRESETFRKTVAEMKSGR